VSEQFKKDIDSIIDENLCWFDTKENIMARYSKEMEAINEKYLVDPDAEVIDIKEGLSFDIWAKESKDTLNYVADTGVLSAGRNIHKPI
jgi:hypothetical protein